MSAEESDCSIKNFEKPQEVFTTAEASAILRMTPGMLTERRIQGKIGCIKDGGYIVFTRQHLEEYQQAWEKRSQYRIDKITASTEEGAAVSLISESGTDRANRLRREQRARRLAAKARRR